MGHIRNNFFFSFLAINFLERRPFKEEVRLSVNMSRNVIATDSLNSFDSDGVQEYGNSIRRHFLNDMVIAYERYSTLMLASHENGGQRSDPSLSKDLLKADRFEHLDGIYQPGGLTFLVQLRRFRNSIVHYNGVYTARNELNYTFGTETYSSRGNEGKRISVEFDNLLWIYDKLMETVQKGDASYFARYRNPSVGSAPVSERG